MNPRVIEVTPHEDHTLTLLFSNGEMRRYDTTPHLELGLFSTLKDLRIFNQAKVVLGTVTWPGDLDICPDTLYEQSVLIKAES